jgi:pyruvate formate lyase activating enzyme
MAEGTIFDIKKYAIHDGPGIRSTVFFKGCPLACRWCHNPEGITVASQRIYRQERCIGCGECIQICPHAVVTQTAEGIVSDPEKCDLCQTCADHCPSEAVEFVRPKSNGRRCHA